MLLKKYFLSQYNIKILEINIDNCYECDLETINDPNNSQYFWINRRDLEIESKRNWQTIFDKCKDSNEIFVRNDLFGKIIKSCKAANLEFLKLKEKLGLWLSEYICDEQELISTSEEIFKEDKIITQHDIENKQLRKEENEKFKKRRKWEIKKIRKWEIKKRKWTIKKK